MEKIKYVLFAVCLIGCRPHTQVGVEIFEYKIYPFEMQSTNGSGMGKEYAYLDCDSFQFVNSKKAYAWVDGTKMCVMAEGFIKVYSNNEFKTKLASLKE